MQGNDNYDMNNKSKFINNVRFAVKEKFSDNRMF